MAKSLKNTLITMNEWMAFHPFDKPDAEEFEYLRVAQQIYKKLTKTIPEDQMPYETMKALSLMMTAYLEDVVSDYGLWAAFRRMHQTMYGRLLPFVDVDTNEYIEDEINPEDVQVLVWMVLQHNAAPNAIVHPRGFAVEGVSEVVYEVLFEAFETVPVNEKLGEFYREADIYEDFFEFRNVYKIFFSTSYLFLGAGMGMVYATLDSLKRSNASEQFAYSVLENIDFENVLGPLSMFAHEYWAELIADMPKESAMLKAVVYHKPALFEYIGKDEQAYQFKLWNSEEIFNVAIDSFDLNEKATEEHFVLTQLVRFNGTWNINGAVAYIPKDEAEKSPMAQEVRVKAENKETYELMLKANDNSPIAYIGEASDLQEFLGKVFADLPQQKLPKDVNEDACFVVYATPEIGITFVPQLARMLKSSDNPFYDEAFAENNAMSVIASKGYCGKELLHYIIENKMLPDAMLNPIHGKEAAKALVQTNMDFIARFFLQQDYTGNDYLHA